MLIQQLQTVLFSSNIFYREINNFASNFTKFDSNYNIRPNIHPNIVFGCYLDGCLDGCLGVWMVVWADVIIRVKFRKIRGDEVMENLYRKLLVD
jgi:hypothetical protein